ncbi:MAG: glutamate-cysteine ligase family protein [Candidatus Woesearchaeota archaeon]
MSENNGLYGFELEFIVTTKDGVVANEVDNLLPILADEYEINAGNVSLPQQYISGSFVGELSHGVIEYNSLPFSSLTELERRSRADLLRSNEVCAANGLKIVPVSQLGPGEALKLRTDKARYIFLRHLLGEHSINTYKAVCGTHIHLDRKTESDALKGQYNLLQSLDPVFVLLSTSPFLKGTNTFNVSRVQACRNQIFSDFPLHGQLVDYIDSIEQLGQLNQLRVSELLKFISDKPWLEVCFDEYDGCWGPIRLKPKTIEPRNSDANLLSLIIAKIALYKGVCSYVFDKGLDIKVGTGSENYRITDSEIILPSYPQLKNMEFCGAVHGLKSETIYQCLSYLVGLAKDGLSHEEHKYLMPFNHMLQARRNIADVLFDYASDVGLQSPHTIGNQTAEALYMFMWSLYQRDLTGRLDLGDIIKNPV